MQEGSFNRNSPIEHERIEEKGLAPGRTSLVRSCSAKSVSTSSIKRCLVGGVLHEMKPFLARDGLLLLQLDIRVQSRETRHCLSGRCSRARAESSQVLRTRLYCQQTPGGSCQIDGGGFEKRGCPTLAFPLFLAVASSTS